jgi:hypothetical protein
MLGLAALVYLTALFCSMFGLAIGSDRKRHENYRAAETARFERARELQTP